MHYPYVGPGHKSILLYLCLVLDQHYGRNSYPRIGHDLNIDRHLFTTIDHGLIIELLYSHYNPSGLDTIFFSRFQYCHFTTAAKTTR